MKKSEFMGLLYLEGLQYKRAVSDSRTNREFWPLFKKRHPSIIEALKVKGRWNPIKEAIQFLAEGSTTSSWEALIHVERAWELVQEHSLPKIEPIHIQNP